MAWMPGYKSSYFPTLSEEYVKELSNSDVEDETEDANPLTK